jgi:hypothetical protein
VLPPLYIWPTAPAAAGLVSLGPARQWFISRAGRAELWPTLPPYFLDLYVVPDVGARFFREWGKNILALTSQEKARAAIA